MCSLPIVLFEGYSAMEDDKYYANSSCTLLKGSPNVIIDTMTAWDGERIKEALHTHGLNPDDINYVVCTHGHLDHVGCNYLFQNATHIVGYDVSHKDEQFEHDFKAGHEYIINDDIKVIATPGHTMQDVSVIIRTNEGIYVAAGDLFECEDDLNDEEIWKTNSMDCNVHKWNRSRILGIADYIIPGHGPMFKVPK